MNSCFRGIKVTTTKTQKHNPLFAKRENPDVLRVIYRNKTDSKRRMVQ